MQWNLMDVDITDVHDVIPVYRESLQVMGKTMQQQYLETLKKKSTSRIGIYSS